MPLFSPPGGGAHPDLATHEALGLATDTGLSDHDADTTAVHGIADTSLLSTTAHDHDADYEAAGGIATHSADSTAVHGIADTAALSLTSHDHDADYEAAGGIATHAGLADPHTGYRLESADHSHASTGLQGGTVSHDVLTDVSVDDHHAQLHTASHLPTGTDPINPFVQNAIGTADLAIANTETVVVSKVFAANELAAGMTFMFKAYATRAGTTSASPVIRIRIGTTTLTGNIAATLTPPVNALAVGNSIEGMVTIRSAGAGGTALGSLMHTVHLAAVTITESLGVSTATVAVNTTSANQRVELTFISGNAANTYTWRNAVIYRVA